MSLYQTVVALLPGFCFVYVRSGFLQARHIEGDTRQVFEALTLTAILWAFAEAVLGLIHCGILIADWVFQRHWNGPAGFLPTVFDGTAPQWQALPTILGMNAVALVLGFLSVTWQRPSGKTMRTVHIGKQVWDPNPQVWSFWMNRPEDDQRFFRVHLKGGRIVVGQIILFSEDPNDALQDVVIKGISEITAENAIEIADVDEMLISRSEIASIDMLFMRPSPNA